MVSVKKLFDDQVNRFDSRKHQSDLDSTSFQHLVNLIPLHFNSFNSNYELVNELLEYEGKKNHNWAWAKFASLTPPSPCHAGRICTIQLTNLLTTPHNLTSQPSLPSVTIAIPDCGRVNNHTPGIRLNSSTTRPHTCPLHPPVRLRYSVGPT